MVSLVYLFNSLLYANTIVMLSVGLTLTYLTTRVPNFAHGSLATVGAYMMFTVAAVVMKESLVSGNISMPLVLGFVLAFLGGAFAGLMEYLIVLRPLKRRGTGSLGLMISTLGVDIFMVGLLNIYADILRGMRPATGVSRDWWLRSYVLSKVAGIPVGVWVSFGVMIGCLTLLYMLLTRTRFGIAMRASIENPQLAQVLGVNVDLVNMASWIIAGGLAGLAGALMAFVVRINPVTGSDEVVAIFAASIVGGLQSLLGGVVGGYIVGLSSTLGTKWLGDLVGVDLAAYKRAVPLIFIIIVLLVAPQGLMGVDWSRLRRRIIGGRSVREERLTVPHAR
ncbi:MAG: branched-chain amino acid ABC transporter permease [Hyperthermus sp.]|nr:MAG: branched-chain amino acid ABC transporter permease [Hyperthermus sp.]